MGAKRKWKRGWRTMPVQQAAKGVERESERGCFSTTSCSRHPQTPLDSGCYIERERMRKREKEKEGERKLGNECCQTIKVPNSLPTVHLLFLSSTFGLFDLDTHSLTRVCM